MPLTRRNAALLSSAALTGAALVGAAPEARAQADSPADRYFDSAGLPIHFIEAGRGEPVVLLHGYTVDIGEQWITTQVFPILARRYRTIALDARGHGRSGKPHDRAAYGREMGFDIVRLMDHLGLRRAHVVGYSMGAHVVAQLLTLRPERFLTATLGGSSGRRNWSVEDQRRVEVESDEMDSGVLRSQILRLWPRDKPPPGEEELRALSAQQMAGKDNHALAAVRRSNPDQVVSVAQMQAVWVPTLGIVGSNDPYLQDFRQLRAAMPQLELVVVEGASHEQTPRRPEFVQMLLGFLAMHPDRTG